MTAVSHVSYPHAFPSLVAQPHCYVAEPTPARWEVAWVLQDSTMCLGRRCAQNNVSVLA